MSQQAPQFKMTLRVLGYEEGGVWAAHCLETDLIGRGETFGKALEDLTDLTAMQIGFAHFKNQPELINRPAPPHIFEIYTTLVGDYFRTFLKNPSNPTQVVGSLELSEGLGAPGQFSLAGA